MHEFFIEDYFPDDKIEGGIERANELHWNISITHQHGFWWVMGGDQPIFKADSRDLIDIFLYGFGLAYVVLPQDIFDNLKADVDNLDPPEEHL